MSITKPTLTKPWASDASANMVDPGGANDTGMPSAAKSIPRRWLNWILNKVDAATRYLVARGIPDWDAAEDYTVGDRIQGSNGRTYKCILASHDNNPTNRGWDTYWEEWGHTTTTFGEMFGHLLVDSFPALFTAAFDTQFPISLPISLNGLTATPTPGDVASNTGTVSDVFMFNIGLHNNNYGLRLVAFTVTDCGTPNGYFDVYIRQTARISGGPKIWVQRVADVKKTIFPRAYLHTTGADIDGITTDVYRIDWADSSFADGPHPTINVFILGTPANT